MTQARKNQTGEHNTRTPRQVRNSPEPQEETRSPEPQSRGRQPSPRLMSPEPTMGSPRLSPEPTMRRQSTPRLSPEPVMRSPRLSPEPTRRSQSPMPRARQASPRLSPEPTTGSPRLSPEPTMKSPRLSPEPARRGSKTPQPSARRSRSITPMRPSPAPFKIDLDAGAALRAARMAAFGFRSKSRSTSAPPASRSATPLGARPVSTSPSRPATPMLRRSSVMPTLVHFMVPQLEARMGQQLLLVGGDPALGDWQPEAGLLLQPCEGGVWVGCALLPSGTPLEAKLVLSSHQGPMFKSMPDGRTVASFTVNANSISLNSSLLFMEAQDRAIDPLEPLFTWEDGPNRNIQVVAGRHNLVVCEWSDTRWAPSLLDTIRCDFIVPNKIVPPGHWLAATGDHPALGRNQPGHAPVLRWTHGNTWMGHVDLPRDVALSGVDVKLLVCSYADEEATSLYVETETGPMRTIKALDPDAIGIRAIMDWGEPSHTQLHSVSSVALPEQSPTPPPASPRPARLPTSANSPNTPTSNPANNIVPAPGVHRLTGGGQGPASAMQAQQQSSASSASASLPLSASSLGEPAVNKPASQPPVVAALPTIETRRPPSVVASNQLLRAASAADARNVTASLPEDLSGRLSADREATRRHGAPTPSRRASPSPSLMMAEASPSPAPRAVEEEEDWFRAPAPGASPAAVAAALIARQSVEVVARNRTPVGVRPSLHEPVAKLLQYQQRVQRLLREENRRKASGNTPTPARSSEEAEVNTYRSAPTSSLGGTSSSGGGGTSGLTSAGSSGGTGAGLSSGGVTRGLNGRTPTVQPSRMPPPSTGLVTPSPSYTAHNVTRIVNAMNSGDSIINLGSYSPSPGPARKPPAADAAGPRQSVTAQAQMGPTDGSGSPGVEDDSLFAREGGRSPSPMSGVQDAAIPPAPSVRSRKPRVPSSPPASSPLGGDDTEPVTDKPTASTKKRVSKMKSPVAQAPNVDAVPEPAAGLALSGVWSDDVIIAPTVVAGAMAAGVTVVSEGGGGSEGEGGAVDQGLSALVKPGSLVIGGTPDFDVELIGVDLMIDLNFDIDN